MPSTTPGPANSCTQTDCGSPPSAGVYVRSTLPGPGTRISTSRYTSPYA